MVGRFRNAASEPARGIEREKPHAGFFAIAMHVGAHVSFGECPEPRKCGHASGANAFHSEWNQPDPGMLIPFAIWKRVDGEIVRNEALYIGGGDPEVEEEEIAPTLIHGRAPFGAQTQRTVFVETYHQRLIPGCQYAFPISFWKGTPMVEAI